jgi:hypothetical protein
MRKITAFDTYVNFTINGDEERIYRNITKSSTRRLQRQIYRMQLANPDNIRIEVTIGQTFGWEAFIES